MLRLSRSPLLQRVCFGHVSLAPVSTVPGQLCGGKQHSSYPEAFLLLIEVERGYVFSRQRDKLSTCSTGLRCKHLFNWPLGVRETLYYFSLSLCWMCIHLHILNQNTMRTCALRDNQKKIVQAQKCMAETDPSVCYIRLILKKGRLQMQRLLDHIVVRPLSV